MKPIQFPEANTQLIPPDGVSADQCGNLPVHRTGEFVISCWRGTFRERLQFLFTGRLWLWVMSKTTQPPVAMTLEHPFIDPGDWEQRHSTSQAPRGDDAPLTAPWGI